MSGRDFLPPRGATIAVGISGGVDSSVSAHLLKRQGYRVFGIFMKNWEEGFSSGYCTLEEDIEDARDVCESLGIELHLVDFVRAYHERVFKHFLAEYAAGRTPNPDILCNREIKFAELAHYASQLGADFLATGHYARRGLHQGQPALLQGRDKNKDQSYFLSQITPEQLARAVFPLGGLEKSQVRALAREAGLVTFDKKDSTGICFIGERPFRDFLSNYFQPQPGPMCSAAGQRLGEHRGLMFYTIGQRSGLHIGGIKGASEEPWYVLDKDLTTNTLIVGQGEHPGLYHRNLLAIDCAWLNERPQEAKIYGAKIRHRQDNQPCQIHWRGEELVVSFSQPQRAISPGQYVALYDGERCLGGGLIGARFN